MRITISGPPGSGTTSLSRHLAAEHNLQLISAGEVFRQLAREKGMDLAAFGELAENDPSIDLMIDARQKQIAAEQDDIIVEGRLSGRMVEQADLRIWLNAPLACRVGRIAFRDSVTSEEKAMALTREREVCEAKRYMMYYQIDINDLSSYHLVLNTERWSVGQLGLIVNCAIAAVRE